MNSHIDDYSKHFDPDYELPDPPPAEELSPATRMLFGWTVQVAGAGMLIFGAMNLILATANGTIAPPYGLRVVIKSAVTWRKECSGNLLASWLDVALLLDQRYHIAMH